MGERDQATQRARSDSVNSSDIEPTGSVQLMMQSAMARRGQSHDLAQRLTRSDGGAVQMKGGAGGGRPVHEAAAWGVSGGGRPLPHLDAIQSAFGRHDVSSVQAHVGGAARTAADSMGAMAYATGNHVAFRASPDLHTAAHEAAHVVQQRGGVQLKGGVGARGDRYERHADAVADRVVSGRSAEGLLDEFAGSGSSGAVTQAKAVQFVPNWSRMEWSELSSTQQGHWTTLGWDEARWNGNNPPASESKIWTALSDAERAAATGLGYSEQEWNDELPASTNDTLNQIVADETNESGSVDHSTAAEADTAIRTHLASYVRDAVTAGRQIAGQVAVVGDDQWDTAGEYHYGYTRWHSPRSGQTRLYRDSINGFVDRHGRVWIHKDRGNAGTMIHEATHKYSDAAMIGVSQPLNEGVTEYFTRKVCDAASIDISGRRNYQANWRCVTQLASLVTEATLAAAYFSGNMSGLETAFTTAKSAADWTAFVAATRSNDWATATTKCTP